MLCIKSPWEERRRNRVGDIAKSIHTTKTVGESSVMVFLLEDLNDVVCLNTHFAVLSLRSYHLLWLFRPESSIGTVPSETPPTPALNDISLRP